MSALQKNVLGIPLSAVLGVLTFAGIALLKVPLVWVLLGLGTIGSLQAWRKLG
jgi:chromate transporter